MQRVARVRQRQLILIEIYGVIVENRKFFLLHVYLAPPLGVTPIGISRKPLVSKN